MQRRWLGMSLVGVLALASLYYGSPRVTAQEPAATPTPEGLAAELAVVEADKLAKQHPEYEQLKALEEDIDKINLEIRGIQTSEVDKTRDEARKAMEKAMQSAKAEMEAEQASISGELQGLASALQARMGAELSEYKVKLDGEIKAMIAKEQQKAGISSTTPGDSGNSEIAEYRANLIQLGSRTLAARRFELQKADQSKLAAERSRLDQQLADYEDQIASRYQEEKLNLQLKMQNSPDEEEEKKYRDRLNAIDDEVAAAKQAKRQEIETSMESFRAKVQQDHEAAVARHKEQITSEMKDKVAERAGVLRSKAAPVSAPVREEIQRKVAEAQANMTSLVASRKAELEGQMKAKEAEARGRLERKQKEVSARLTQLNKQLREKLAERSEFLSKAGKEKLAAKKKELEKAKQAHQQVYDKIFADLSTAVGKVADKKGIPCVIGSFQVNNSLTDLTDLSVVEVVQIGKN